MVEQMAGTKPEPPAIPDADGRLLETDEEICEAFTIKLEKQFRISEDENQDFDDQFEDKIQREHQQNLPQPPIFINRLRLSKTGQEDRHL